MSTKAPSARLADETKRRAPSQPKIPREYNTQASALPFDLAEMMRERLDRFELIAEVASGGMATVLLARLGGVGGFQRLYAIKRLHAHLASSGEFVEMFLDEARLAARIHHPNVVPILEIGTSADRYYLVMEYIEGDTAAHLFGCAAQDGKDIAARVAIRIALDALAGLHAAHELTDDDGSPLEIVHRDVSPHNILVGVDGVSRITDFGIARAAARLSTTRSGQLKGKVAYMAPEQARSERVDRRADVFSLGICLWEMLTMRRLFKAEDDGETLNRLLYEPIPTIKSAVPGTAPEVDAVCMRALCRDPDERFASAAEFLDALERAARPLDLVGTHREVASCVDDVLGNDIAERRAAVRAWQSDLPPATSTVASSTRPPSSALAESGTLGLHPEVAVHRSTGSRRSATRVGATLAAAGIAISLGALEWRRAGGSASSSSLRSPPARTMASGPSDSSWSSPAPIPTAASSNDAADGAPSLPEVPPTASPTPRTMAPPARASRPTSPPTPAAPAPPAVSVPSDMLVNPYR
jgi:serine/threonine protein kinase